MRPVKPKPVVLGNARAKDAALVSLEKLGMAPTPADEADARERLALIRRIIYPGRAP